MEGLNHIQPLGVPDPISPEILGLPSLQKQMRQDTVAYHALASRRVLAIRKAIAKLKDIDIYIRSVSYHVLSEMAQLIGQPGSLSSLSHALPPRDFGNLVDFLHVEPLNEVQKDLTYDAWYTLLAPLEEIRPEITKSIQRLHDVCKVTINIDRINGSSLEELKVLFAKSGRHSDEVTKVIYETAKLLWVARNDGNQAIAGLQADRATLDEEDVRYWNDAKDSEERYKLLQVIIEGVMSSEKETRALNLERGTFIATWRRWRALVQYDAISNMLRHWQDLGDVISILDKALN